MNKRFWLAFIIVQVIGEACYWIWPLLPSPVNMFLWGAYMILLCPGNFVASVIVESFFWGKLTLTQMSFIELPIKLAVNALSWMFCFYLWKMIRVKANKLDSNT